MYIHVIFAAKISCLPQMYEVDDHVSSRVFHSSLHNFIYPVQPSSPPSCPSINLCSTYNRLSQQHHQPERIYVNTEQKSDHITSWVCKMAGPSIWQPSSPYHLWLCQQSLLCPALELWELCLTPLCLCRPLWSGAQGGRDAQPTVNIIHSLYKVRVVVGFREWGGLGWWGKWRLTEKCIYTFYSQSTSTLKQTGGSRFCFCLVCHWGEDRDLDWNTASCYTLNC